MNPLDERVRGGAIVGFSLRRPVTVGMLALALVVVGVIARVGVPLELIPSGFTPPFLYVEIPTLGASPSDVEDRIAIPVEEMLGTVRNIDSLRTRVRTNSASFFIEFRDGTDMDVAYNQVRDRVDRVMPTFGDEVGQYFVWKYNPADEAILWFSVSFDDETNGSWLVENLVIPKLDRISGVSRVEAHGAQSRVVSIEVDDRLAQAAGPGISGLVEQLGRDNFSMSGGEIDDGGVRLPLRLTSRFTSVDQLREIPVGNGLRLGEIADVGVEDRAERAVYRVDQQPGIVLAVYKEASANTVEVADAVRRVVEEQLKPDPRLAGSDYAYFFDQGSVIEEAIDNLESTALWGGALALVILAFFLRRPGMTLLVTFAIPASLLVTVVVIYFSGRSLNVLSLTGMMLAVGMVVDNAIVVVESIQARMLAGDSAKKAAYRGASEVAVAVVVATLTTVVVFLPLILMTGNETMSFYMSHIGMPVSVALLASLVVSLAFLPLAAAVGLRGRPPARVAVVEWLMRRYESALSRALRRRGDALALAALVFASMFVVRGRVPSTDQAEPNINDFEVHLSMPAEASWSEKVDILLDFERALFEQKDALGIAHVRTRMRGAGTRAQVRALLADPDDRPLERDEIMERALDLLPVHPGVTAALDWTSGGAGESLEVRVMGRDTRTAAALAEEAARRLRHVSGVTAVRTESGDDGELELHFVVDRERALRLGLNAWTVGGALDFALRGRQLESLRAGSDELPIIVEGDVREVDEVAEIANLELPSPVTNVRLGDVASTVHTAGFGAIDRIDGRSGVSISVVTGREDLDVLNAEIREVLSGMEWPRGYTFEFGGRFDVLIEGAAERAFAVLLSICCVFLLMGVLFESVVLPLSILLSIPFAFVGVYWALFLTGTSFDTMAAVGLIILIGVVVNNAIVLVDRIGELRREGMPRDEAIATAGRQRLRPIVMTAATTIVGLIPMAMGTSSMVGIPYSPLGRSVIGGLVASTGLTLFVVPLFYAVLDDARTAGTRLVSELLRTAVGQRRGGDDATPPDAAPR